MLIEEQIEVYEGQVGLKVIKPFMTKHDGRSRVFGGIIKEYLEIIKVSMVLHTH